MGAGAVNRKGCPECCTPLGWNESCVVLTCSFVGHLFEASAVDGGEICSSWVVFPIRFASGKFKARSHAPKYCAQRCNPVSCTMTPTRKTHGYWVPTSKWMLIPECVAVPYRRFHAPCGTDGDPRADSFEVSLAKVEVTWLKNIEKIRRTIKRGLFGLTGPLTWVQIWW